MGIADADKVAPIELSKDPKCQKARQRADACLKRRAHQFVNGHLPSTWSICTDLQRRWARRRMRRLLPVAGGAAGASSASGSYGGRSSRKMYVPKQASDLKQRSRSFFWYTLLPMLIVLGISCSIAMYQNGDAVSSFMQRYVSQYRAIVHNKMNYCSRDMPAHDIFQNIGIDVLNQELALKQLELAMANQSSFQSIALVGSSGLGKTLTLRLLLDQYPWKENMHSIAWNDIDLINNDVRYGLVDCLLRNLAHCGRNLLIIDNLSPCDKDYVGSVNSYILKRSDVAYGSNDPDLKQLTVIYVFNLNRYLGDELYERQVQMVSELPLTTVVHYHPFDIKELEMCVRHEAKVIGMSLDEEHVQEILNSTDVSASGCKTVRSKVMLYARPELDDQESL